MPIGRRLFLGAFTAGAVTLAVDGEAAAADAYTEYTSPARFRSTSTTAHTLTAVMAATSPCPARASTNHRAPYAPVAQAGGPTTATTAATWSRTSHRTWRGVAPAARSRTSSRCCRRAA